MRTIRVDTWVRTADGATGPVCAVLTDDDLIRVDLNGVEVDLPRSELRVIVPPHRKLPPITGIPALRPACAWCHKRLPVRAHRTTKWDGRHHVTVSRTFFCFGTDNIFCSGGHAYRFALAAHKAGYRMVKP